MTQTIEPSTVQPPVGSTLWLASGAVGLLLAYVLVFSLTGSRPGEAIGAAAANVAPAAALGVAVNAVVVRWVAARPRAQQTLAHIGLGLAFVSAWYGLLIPTLAISSWLSGGGFHLTPLTGPALPWQLFQGLLLYVVIAALAHALGRREPADAPGARRLDRYLIRVGEEIRPVDVTAIIAIKAADDYSEVSTADGTHLARLSLQTFADRLDPEQFIRVHRSRIINFARLEKIEPAGGGRMLAVMESGEIVPTSRAGAQALRDRLA